MEQSIEVCKGIGVSNTDIDSDTESTEEEE